MADFEPYAPSNGDPSAFIAQPLIHEGKIELIVALQLPLEGINSIMQERSGMGKTGETYLVGEDLLMRSDSFLDSVNHTVLASFNNPDTGSVDTEATKDAFEGNSGNKVIIDYNGNPVLSAFTPIKLWNTNWALIAEIDQAEVNSPINALILSIAVIGLIVSGFIIFIALFIASSIAKPLKVGLEISNKLAKGDINQDIQVTSNDETGQLLAAMKNMITNLKGTVSVAEKISRGDLTAKVNLLSDRDVLGKALSNMVTRLSEIVGNIKTSAENVSSGSQELSSSAQQMSQGSTEQASSTEEVSSSMEEMGSNIRQNADNALQTEKISRKAAKYAGESGSAVTEAVQAMKEIADKISIIEEIARQTNLLALNAAIEAARAGEHGKGFAVVASEVRKLAERSQTAAGEISELSGSSVTVAEKAGEMLIRLVPDIEKTADLVQEISAASREQNNGTEQINRAILQLDQVVQQNASASEEMASTSEELASQAEQMQAAISFFSTNGTSSEYEKKFQIEDYKHTTHPEYKAKTNLLNKENKTGIVVHPADKEEVIEVEIDGSKTNKIDNKKVPETTTLLLNQDKMDSEFEEF